MTEYEKDQRVREANRTTPCSHGLIMNVVGTFLIIILVIKFLAMVTTPPPQKVPTTTTHRVVISTTRSHAQWYIPLGEYGYAGGETETTTFKTTDE